LKFIKEFDGKPVRGKRLFRISFLWFSFFFTMLIIIL
jgi:hypothetical protein